MKVKKTILAIVRNLIAWIFSAICLIPLLLILFNSLKDKKAASKMNLYLPELPIQWSNFIKVIFAPAYGTKHSLSDNLSLTSVSRISLINSSAKFFTSIILSLHSIENRVHLFSFQRRNFVYKFDFFHSVYEILSYFFLFLL